jgi:hypothetical protein
MTLNIKTNKVATVFIRYNTASIGESDRWRVIVDGKEYITKNVEIFVPCITTKDEIEGVGTKFHVTCFPKHIVRLKDRIILTNNENEHGVVDISYKVQNFKLAMNLAADKRAEYISDKEAELLIRIYEEMNLKGESFSTKDYNRIITDVNKKYAEKGE